VLVEDDRLGKQLVLIGNLPYTAGTVHLSHEDQVVQEDIHKVQGWGSDPGRDEAARRRSGGVGRGRERGERGREGRSGAVAQRQRGDAGRGNECAEAPERMIGSAPGTAGRAPGAEESSSPGSSK
jgi:hypothetical protein